MSWLPELIGSLETHPVCGYYPGQAAFAEPTALSALALLAAGRRASAAKAVTWLADQQQEDGSLIAGPEMDAPRWPTSLAVLAWSACLPHDASLQRSITAGVEWICENRSQTLQPTPDLGHDVQLVAWSWVHDTHAWIEPTALHVLALKAVAMGQHARVREAVRLLMDRQLPDGGCNYGNTTVLGTMLRPHPQPTGVALLALADEPGAEDANARSVAYLNQTLEEGATTISLCWTLMGMAACSRFPDSADGLLDQAQQAVRRQDSSPYKMALIGLAALRERCPLVTLPRGDGVVESPITKDDAEA